MLLSSVTVRTTTILRVIWVSNSSVAYLNSKAFPIGKAFLLDRLGNLRSLGNLRKVIFKFSNLSNLSNLPNLSSPSINTHTVHFLFETSLAKELLGEFCE